MLKGRTRDVMARRARCVVVLLALMTQAACSGAGGDGAGDDTDRINRDRVRAEQRVAIPTQPPGRDGETSDGSTAGSLDGDAELDGGCLWIVEGDGTIITVRWPHRWSAAFDPPRLVDESGHVVAEAGETVVLAGGFSTELPALMDRCIVNREVAFDAHNARQPMESLDEP